MFLPSTDKLSYTHFAPMFTLIKDWYYKCSQFIDKCHFKQVYLYTCQVVSVLFHQATYFANTGVTLIANMCLTQFQGRSSMHAAGQGSWYKVVGYIVHSCPIFQAMVYWGKVKKKQKNNTLTWQMAHPMSTAVMVVFIANQPHVWI